MLYEVFRLLLLCCLIVGGLGFCGTYEYYCTLDRCIGATWVCDGSKDCEYGDDESAVNCRDNVYPRFDLCPDDINDITDPGTNYQTARWREPNARDNRGIKYRGKSHSPGWKFYLRNGNSTAHTVRYWATDYAGNTAYCIFTITVMDEEPPKIECTHETYNFYKMEFGFTMISTDEGSPNATITWTANATDNSEMPHITSFPYKSGDVFLMRLFPPYETTIRASDPSDTESPVVNCPTRFNTNFAVRTSTSSWTVFPARASTPVQLYWSPASATDNSGTVVSLSSNYNPGDVFPVSNVAYQITYTAIDEAGNVGNCSIFLTVEDWESPLVECPSHIESRNEFQIWNIVVSDNLAVGHIIANDSRVVPANYTLNHNATTLEQNGTFPVGTTSIEYKVTDIAGNIGRCVLTITIIDTESPVVNCPSRFNTNFAVRTSTSSWTVFPASTTVQLYWSPASATDNSGTVVSLSSNYNPGDVFPVSNVAYQITYTAIDEAGNVGNCSIFLTVEDWESPLVECPSHIESRNEFQIWNIVVSDNLAVGHIIANDSRVVPANYTLNHNATTLEQNGTFPVGTTSIEYKVTDVAGNIGRCVLTITIIDNERPVVNCPSHSSNFASRESNFAWSVSTDRGSKFARLHWPPANATDNSGTVVSVTSNYNPGDVFGVSNAAYQITYTAIDEVGNTGYCSFFITVQDLESPSIKCPSQVDSRSAFVSWEITLSDNVAVVHFFSNDSRVTPTNSLQNQNDITVAQSGTFPIGTSFIEYLVTDLSWNAGKCSMKITVLDTERPSIMCPSNFSNHHDYIFGIHRLVTDYGQSYATVTWCPPEIKNNNDGPVTWDSYPYTSGDKFPLRLFPPYVVKFTASDLFGNSKSCYVYFSIIDIEPPTITCPTNITNYYDTYFGINRAALDPGSSTSTVMWDDPTVFDNSGRVVIVTSTHQSGESFAPRFYPPYEVEYTAEDESGNKNFCKFYFLVSGNSDTDI
ncbi:hyalin-like isoform X2 [Anneissia japonica]|uniref:hyalin-like isoform X2 n=1 Tax=Anneissia japonica TaxID=1529436 RepID=UPI001425A4CD|nr:hyalin-like isoform X2 [Anneissia japonica]